MTTLDDAQVVAGDFARKRATVSIQTQDVIAQVAVFLALLLIFSLVTLAFFWTPIQHLNTALIGPPEDNMQDFWNTWYAAVAADPHHVFATNLLRFPQGTSLIYQSFAYPQVVAVVALSHIFGRDLNTLIALQNLTLLASFPLAGAGAYYFVRHFTPNTFGALAGAFVFAFNPSHVIQTMHHAHVSSIEFIPFFALAYLLALERRSMGWLVAAAAFNALSALSCWYYLFYGAYFMGFQLLYARMRDGAWPRGWPVNAAGLCLIFTAVALSPLIAPMMLAAAPSVYEPGGNIYVADLFGFFAFPRLHIFSALSRGLYARFTGNLWEGTVYLGLVNLAILGWRWRRTGIEKISPAPYVLGGMIMFAVLACGESLHVAGVLTHVPLPDAALDKLPFFANVRTPSRAIVFVYLFLAIGTGSGLAALWSRNGRARAAALALAALVVADFYPATLAATPVACPAELHVLEADRLSGVGVLNLPWGYAEENAYMLEQVCHRLPIVDGMTTRDMGDPLLFHLALKDLASQRKQLVGAHVKYILVHLPRSGRYVWNPELAPLADYLKTYRPVESGPDMIVLKVY